jgi:hypothetical protein
MMKAIIFMSRKEKKNILVGKMILFQQLDILRRKEEEIGIKRP